MLLSLHEEINLYTRSKLNGYFHKQSFGRTIVHSVITIIIMCVIIMTLHVVFSLSCGYRHITVTYKHGAVFEHIEMT